MSIEAVHWALDVPVGGNAKVILIGVANHAHPDGTGSFPALDTLAEYAHCDRSTARRNLRKLEEDGWIERTGTGPKGQATWRLLFARKGGKTLRGKTPQVASGVASGVAPTPPEPITDKVGDKSPTPPDATTLIFDAWLASTERSARTVFEGKRKRVVRNALKRYPVIDLLDAVDGWRFSAHHRGDNATGTVYNELTLLLRDAEHIEKFRDLKRRGVTERPALRVVPGNVGDLVRKLREAEEAS